MRAEPDNNMKCYNNIRTKEDYVILCIVMFNTGHGVTVLAVVAWYSRYRRIRMVTCSIHVGCFIRTCSSEVERSIAVSLFVPSTRSSSSPTVLLTRRTRATRFYTIITDTIHHHNIL